MPAEPPPFLPLPPEIEQQLGRLNKHLKTDLRFSALRWLIDFQKRGNYGRDLAFPAKEIYLRFYEYSIREKLSEEVDKKGKTEPDIEEAKVARVKKLFGEIAEALVDYYDDKGPGANDLVHIELKRGQGGRFEPVIQVCSKPAFSSALGFETAGSASGVISDDHFISAIEAKVPDSTTDIWVAAPDLANVGDGTSPFSQLVRKTVGDNASRGINYSYLCALGDPGQSRLRHLRECFVGTPGQLFLRQIPPEQFCEITIVQAHFISFNPLSRAPEAYMQLPLPQAHKGWIKLSRIDAARVVAAMKRLIDEYPPEPLDIEGAPPRPNWSSAAAR